MREQAIRRVLLLAIGVHCGLALTKFIVGRATGLLAVEADGLHASGDSLTSVAGLVALAIAARLGLSAGLRLEVLAARGVGWMLVAVGAWMFVHLGTHLEAGPPGEESAWVLVTLAGTAAVQAGLARLQLREAERLRSPFLRADGQHTMSDLWVTVGVLGSTALGWCGLHWIDHVAAGAVALLVLKVGFDVIRAPAEGGVGEQPKAVSP